jgi:hypothetical protein
MKTTCFIEICIRIARIHIRQKIDFRGDTSDNILQKQTSTKLNRKTNKEEYFVWIITMMATASLAFSPTPNEGGGRLFFPLPNGESGNIVLQVIGRGLASINVFKDGGYAPTSDIESLILPTKFPFAPRS